MEGAYSGTIVRNASLCSLPWWTEGPPTMKDILPPASCPKQRRALSPSGLLISPMASHSEWRGSLWWHPPLYEGVPFPFSLLLKQRKLLEESEPLVIHNCSLISKMRASLVAQLVKNPPAMRETWARSLGCKDPLEKGTTTHSSILA